MTATWNSTKTGSSSSSEKYNLDPNDKSGILVYKYRAGLPEPEITTQAKLCEELDKAPQCRVSRKSIPRGDSRVDIRMEDLWTEEERALYCDKPTAKNSVASVGLPRIAYYKRLLLNSYPELYIVSPASSPNSSANTSPESSQHVSPQSTFPKEPRESPADQ
ncbi:hypothetical protein EJ05DRAFT_314766 [Pseudovirgaria hyperparasitica]|uniref:Uncharacterized protein n=1 Tax=Pseudovirgaria hyperparasitica TaxID=470096 RepID=A0A6A6WAN0_9PEZI|nr:uncharacterized protein EJ05DRAFT_314766 [Pseudovirgaria hyperparasitica]KAF2759918.1 hypothetical protein EJ05DRAFT_314766 [Pseudovirgaria hyperparasitica]